MQYVALTEITTALKARLEALGIFLDVRIAALTSYQNLFEMLPDLATFPAAVISIGSIDFEEAAVIKDNEVSILLIDKFQTSTESAQSIYEIIDATSKSLTADTPGNSLKIAGVHLLPINFRPIEVDGTHSTFQFTLKTTGGFI